ncbi:MAG: hypothetical protein M3552_10345, partial [Planctomycetota bacterium]|nr:hypothetical protein [Planctomycetota bacterium]
IWNDSFAKRRPSAETVRSLVAQLHEARKHDHVVAVIRAAIRSGQVQPWMYEVLALSLEIEGAPRAEVERALLSQVDFSATDAASLMMSAAYLTRFKADGPALRLYRQASELSPERAEPYLLGLKIARRMRDDDALAWAVRGIFASAWGDDHERQHQDAANAVADRSKELRDAGKASEADGLEASLAAARQIDLHVRLEWSGDGDLDLSVREPAGTVCSFENPRTTAGGVLTHDGHGPKQQNCFDDYVCAAAFPGVYRLEVRHAWGDIVGKRAKVTVMHHRGTPHESVRVMTVPVTVEGSVLRVTVTSGRREELLTLTEEHDATSVAKPAPRLVNRLDPAAQAAADRFRDSLFRQVGGGVGGLTPGVGVGAVGYQPTVVIIPDGITLSAQAVVSADRRYVRLTLNPSFNEVIDVLNFTFSTGQ